MNTVSKMSLEEIFDRVPLLMMENDIQHFCNDINVVKEFLKRFYSKHKSQREKEQFLIENSNAINKENLVLLMADNYQNNLVMIEKRMKELTSLINRSQKNRKNLEEYAKFYKQYIIQQQSLKELLNISKGIEAIITYYYYDQEEKRNKIEVIDSREVIDGKRVSKTKNLRRFDDIDMYFKNGDSKEEFGIEYVLQCIVLTDIYNTFPDADFGEDIRRMILENVILKREIKTIDELEKLRCNYEEYTNLIDNINYEEILPEVKTTLREYCAYLDIDKLLLISAYRFNEGLENNYIHPKDQLNIKTILEGILSQLSPNAKIQCEIQDRNDKDYKPIPMTYSINDLRKCLGQFGNRRYVTKFEIEEYRQKVQNQEINLSDIEPDCIYIIFSSQELDELSILNEANFIYASEKLNWQGQKLIEQIQHLGKCSTGLLKSLLNSERLEINQIIQLYESEIVSLESLVSMKEKLVSSEETVFQKMNDYYKKFQEEPDNEEIASCYNRYVNLYKEIFVKGTLEEREKSSNQLMERLVEEYEDKEYLQAIKIYFTEDLLTLDTIAEWNSNDVITDFYQDGLITLENIKELVLARKIPVDYLNNIYTSIVYSDDIDYSERLKYIQSGFVKDDDIIDLYKRNLLFEADLLELANKGITDLKEVQRVINNRTIQDLEKNATIRLTGLNRLTKKNNEIYANGGYGGPDTTITNPKCIIDPNVREEFIEMLGAVRADTDLTEESPFFNYEFYVIPDETGNIGLNSVVIAERYYEDKLTEERFSTENATYFFKYKDLMVLGNLKKSEMTKERKGIIFTANHAIANERRDGYWASSVINNLAKTMLSSNLGEYSKKNQRKIILQKLSELYSKEELNNILEKAIEIDSGRHICEIIEPELGQGSGGNTHPSDGDDER